LAIPAFDSGAIVLHRDGNRTVHLFDLAALRRQLAALGLEGDLPAYLPAAPRARPTGR
jgi:hypothetical protein